MKLLTRPEEFVLLAVWKLQQDAYSLSIRKRLTEVTGHRWSLGSVYTPLDRLVRRGYLTSSESEATAERGGRKKRIYRLTDLGRRQLIRVRTVEQAMWQGVTGLLPAGGAL